MGRGKECSSCGESEGRIMFFSDKEEEKDELKSLEIARCQAKINEFIRKQVRKEYFLQVDERE